MELTWSELWYDGALWSASFVFVMGPQGGGYGLGLERSLLLLLGLLGGFGCLLGVENFKSHFHQLLYGSLGPSSVF